MGLLANRCINNMGLLKAKGQSHPGIDSDGYREHRRPYRGRRSRPSSRWGSIAAPATHIAIHTLMPPARWTTHLSPQVNFPGKINMWYRFGHVTLQNWRRRNHRSTPSGDTPISIDTGSDIGGDARGDRRAGEALSRFALGGK